VVPLLEADFRQRGYLVVLTDTHRARWYAAGPGGARPLGEIDEAVPPKQHSHATLQRHRQDHILHFQKELAQRMEEAWGQYPYQGIILLGEHEILEQFRTRLPARLSSRIAHQAPHAWTEDQAAIDQKVRAVLGQALAADEARVLKELDRRLHEATAVAAGPQEVIDALRDGQVATLILGPDPGASASRCTGCHSLFATTQPTCPYCHAPCRTGNLWQEILALAIRHGIWVQWVQPTAVLLHHGGVAALLARDEPPWGPPTQPVGKPEQAGP
jgi:hypothetical protein